MQKRADIPMLAYIDPGSGSYLLQLILAALLAFAFTIKSFWLGIVAKARSVFDALRKPRSRRHE